MNVCEIHYRNVAKKDQEKSQKLLLKDGFLRNPHPAKYVSRVVSIAYYIEVVHREMVLNGEWAWPCGLWSTYQHSTMME